MMDVAPSCTNPTSTKSYLSQMASFVQWLVVIYLASIVDNASVGCLLQFHEITLTPTKNIYHVVVLQVFASLSNRHHNEWFAWLLEKHSLMKNELIQWHHALEVSLLSID